MKNFKNLMISLLIAILSAIIIFYFFLPPLNIHSLAFWLFIFIILSIFVSTYSLLWFIYKNQKLDDRPIKVTSAIIILIIILIPLINIICSPLFNSKKYAKRIDINEFGNFSKEIREVDFNQMPLLDKDSSRKLGDRVMGQMPELVSQYKVSDLYTQINYNDEIIRVTPLEYNGLFKYLNNKEKGITGYITVNSVNGESKLIKLDKGMKYMDSAIFGKDLNRKLRMDYKAEIFGERSFEIDNEGNPYWIVPTIKYKAIGLRKEISGVVILNPITGESKKYKLEEIPTWVDHVYSANLIIEQVDDWGLYKNGFLNSIFGQKNVIMTTKGYNYTVMNDDVYLYTGITSVSSDEANIGFILTNMRTKETTYYAVPGAEEYSAMDSAVGQVQQMNYTATFPLLINLKGRPTYLISLKDNAGLVKMYAFVDVKDYQLVSVTDASKGIKTATEEYLKIIGGNTENIKHGKIVINTITNATIDGNTYYYITDTNNKKYKVSIKVKDSLPFLSTKDEIEIDYNEEKNINEIIEIK